MELPTGPLAYTLTNDYLFKVFLQRNEKALRGLLCALLSLRKEEIISVTIMNPIEEGAVIDNKRLIMDIKLIMNTDRIINIEMQVADLGNWEERSLTYLCRAFDQLHMGETYNEVKTTIHIGILNYTPKGFPEALYLDYYFYNRQWEHVYSDKISLHMLQLNQLGNPADERKNPELYYWAQLFKATTWEEIGMLAEKSESISEGIVTLKQLTEDEKIRMQCEAWDDYQKNIISIERLGIEKGREIQQKHSIEKMLKKGLTEEDICEIAGCEPTLVEEVRTELESKMGKTE